MRDSAVREVWSEFTSLASRIGFLQEELPNEAAAGKEFNTQSVIFIYEILQVTATKLLLAVCCQPFLMTDRELKTLTSDFNDIKMLLEQRTKIKRDSNRTRRRLRAQFDKYEFLKDMVDIGSSGDKLVNAIVKYFKAIGFKKVENVDKEFQEEDIRLWTEDSLIIFEVTGVDKPQPKYNKAHSVSMHIPARKLKYPNLKVYGGFIVNHDNRRDYKNRNSKPFDGKICEVANGHKYSLLTTVDLLNLFLELKKGAIDKNTILERICVM